MQPQLEILSESEAIRLAQQGNTAAFDLLYRLHSRRVYALCLRMVKNPAQAEDLTHDTFLAVLRGIREFRGRSAFTTWLHQVTRNIVLMCFRKRTLKLTSLDEITDETKHPGRATVEFGKPDHRLEGVADRLLLQAAVKQLPPGCRTALVLHDVQGYQHREVAAILGCSPGTSKSQLHKARLRVRETLEQCFPRRIKNQKRAKSASKADNVLPPAPNHNPPDSEPDSGDHKPSAPAHPRPKPARAIPGWCVPVEAEPPTSNTAAS